MAEPIGMLIERARLLSEGREAWRREAPEVVRALRAAGVPFSTIEREAGIPEGTAARLASSTSDSARSAAPS